ncbi:hypothetical protein [Candidatus Enterococcus ikei]|uniref:Uncharacterized protein n=1 Tax=Candidatus Enterococcus ikei TaxID=2815326 RepID=A0ABS3H237_9ENTE|nr:hypothetical protein [Enterococcus sp. DIV0869a]MBO0441604.1 hypothetical protein [Enterococcus sp. DIV0869a]
MDEVNNLTNGQVNIGPASMYTIKKKRFITLEESNERKKHISLLIKDLRV